MATEDKVKCELCGSTSATASKQELKFPYGTGSSRAELSCLASVTQCSACDGVYLNADAEIAKLQAMHTHVCRINAVLTKQLEEAVKANAAKEGRVVQLISQVRERDSIIRSMRTLPR